MTNQEEIQNAIEWIEGLRNGWNDEDNIKYCNMAIKTLEQTRWIPVTERLPEEWNSVLITFSGKYGNLTAVHAVGTGSLDGINGWYFDEIDGYTERLKVEAWMPLPEPYKAESEDKLDGDPVDIDKAVEHYEGTLETLKGIDLEVDG